MHKYINNSFIDSLEKYRKQSNDTDQGLSKQRQAVNIK